MREKEIKALDRVLNQIEPDKFLQEIIDYFNSSQEVKSNKPISFSIAIYLNGSLRSTRCLGNEKNDDVKIKNTNDAIQLCGNMNYTPDHYRSYDQKIDHTGAIRSNGITIACRGTGDVYKDEYIAFHILFSVWRLTVTTKEELKDQRFFHCPGNHFIENKYIKLMQSMSNFVL